MKVNLHMISHMLPFTDKRVSGEQSREMCLIGWRAYGMQDEMFSKYLYLVGKDRLLRAVTEHPQCCFICTAASAEGDVLPVSGNFILIRGTVPRLELERRLSEAFEQFQQWDAELTEALLNGASFQTVLEIGARLLRNPVGVFDRNGGLLFRSGELGKASAGTLWEYVLETGFSPADEGVDVDLIISLAEKGQKPFFIQSKSGKYASFNRLFCPLHCEGRYLAHLGMQDYNEPLTQFDYSILLALNPKLEFALHRESVYPMLLGGTSLSVTRLLSGESLSEIGLDALLQEWNRRVEEAYCVLVLDSSIFSEERILQHIRKIFPDIRSCTYDGYTVVINYDMASCYDKEKIDQLEQIAHRTGTKIGVSGVQTSLRNLHIGSLQGQMALKNDAESYVHFFLDAYLPYLTRAIAGSPYCPAILYPGFMELMVNTPAYSRTRISTLRQYILSNGNLSDIASALHVHRHTVVYRISKIEQLLGRNLNDLSERERVQLYISCLYVQFMLPDWENTPESTE